MNRARRQNLVNRIETAKDLLRHASNKLASDHRASVDFLRDIQSDLEEAERVIAIVAQDVAD